MTAQPTQPVPLPAGAELRAASARGAVLVCPEPVGPGAVLECDLLLGARALPVMARVVECRPAEPARWHVVEVEFLAMAQIDRDSLVDFITAIGADALRVRPHKGDD
jgi:hypothetical protein